MQRNVTEVALWAHLWLDSNQALFCFLISINLFILWVLLALWTLTEGAVHPSMKMMSSFTHPRESFKNYTTFFLRWNIINDILRMLKVSYIFHRKGSNMFGTKWRWVKMTEFSIFGQSIPLNWLRTHFSPLNSINNWSSPITMSNSEHCIKKRSVIFSLNHHELFWRILKEEFCFAITGIN